MILNYVYCCNSVLASVSYTIAYRMTSKGKSDHPFPGLCVPSWMCIPLISWIKPHGEEITTDQIWSVQLCYKSDLRHEMIKLFDALFWLCCNPVFRRWSALWWVSSWKSCWSLLCYVFQDAHKIHSILSFFK